MGAGGCPVSRRGLPGGGTVLLGPPHPGAAASKSIIYALLGALVVLPTVAARSTDEDPPAVQRMGGRTATFFGDISYGIFCYHLIVLGVIEGLLDYEIFTGGFFLLYVPTLAASVVVAAVSFYVVERPLMRWGRRNERAPVNGSELTRVRATATSTKRRTTKSSTAAREPGHGPAAITKTEPVTTATATTTSALRERNTATAARLEAAATPPTAPASMISPPASRRSTPRAVPGAGQRRSYSLARGNYRCCHHAQDQKRSQA